MQSWPSRARCSRLQSVTGVLELELSSEESGKRIQVSWCIRNSLQRESQPPAAISPTKTSAARPDIDHHFVQPLSARGEYMDLPGCVLTRVSPWPPSRDNLRDRVFSGRYSTSSGPQFTQQRDNARLRSKTCLTSRAYGVLLFKSLPYPALGHPVSLAYMSPVLGIRAVYRVPGERKTRLARAAVILTCSLCRYTGLIAITKTRG